MTNHRGRPGARLPVYQGPVDLRPLRPIYLRAHPRASRIAPSLPFEAVTREVEPGAARGARNDERIHAPTPQRREVSGPTATNRGHGESAAKNGGERMGIGSPAPVESGGTSFSKTDPGFDGVPPHALAVPPLSARAQEARLKK